MIKVGLKVEGIKEATQMLGDLKYKMPSVLARSLTETAKDGKAQVKGWLPRLIDRPTPWTMRSLFIFPAEKTDLRAGVAFKWEAGRASRAMIDDVPAPRSMAAQVYGGQRKMKSSERRLLFNGITTSARPYLIPAKGAPLDAYGNVRGSFMNKVLYTGVKGGSALDRSSIQMNNRSQSESKYGQYFVLRKDHGRTPVGIFKNMGKKASPMPVFIFASKAHYTTRVPFHRIVKAECDRRWPIRLEESVNVIIAKYKK